jgi:hypothetical protein
MAAVRRDIDARQSRLTHFSLLSEIATAARGGLAMTVSTHRK